MNFLKATSLTLLALSTVTRLAALSFDVNTLPVQGPIGGNTPGGFFYKYEGTEEGPGADFFSGAFSADGLTATVSWNPVVYQADFETIYLKASNEYVFWDVSGVNWSLFDSFTVTNSYITNQRGIPHEISHVSADGSTHAVPDGGATACMLAGGIGMICLLRRFLPRPTAG